MRNRLIALLLSLATTAVFAAVDVNKATEADLDSIKGIGPGTSSKILEQRKSAPFKNWGDFMTRVSGIGEKRAAKLSQEGLTVNGEPFKPGAAAVAEKKPAAKP
jgi:competence protein ComEA